MSDKPSLLSLPVEIRLQIYSYLDHDDCPIEYPLSEPHGSQASFILTCRQLRYEMHHDFFSKNVFAVRFNSDMPTGSTEHPFFKEVHAMAGKFKRIDDLQLPMFHVQRTGLLSDMSTLERDGQRESTDLRPFERCSALGDGLEMIENLQLHVFHWRLQPLRPTAIADMLPEYIGNCKEQLNAVVEALVRLKAMKGPLGLRKLTVVDYIPPIRDNVPYIQRAWGEGTPRFRTMRILQAMLADAHWPVLTQAAATLGISIENVKVRSCYFSEDRLSNKRRNGASTKAVTREDAETKA